MARSGSPRRQRLDAELVRRGLARSRGDAASLVEAGRVTVAGVVATKPATAVSLDVAVVVREDPDDPGYVSRGGHKLAGALDAFVPRGLRVEGRRCLDAGASTGGFTDVLLRAGAARVAAVDVGYGQLAWSIRNDDRVDVHDRTHVRDVTTELLGGAVDLVVGDLSFISLRLLLAPLVSVTAPDGDLVLMVKPQFEVGKDRVGKGGVVRDPALHVESVQGVVEEAAGLGWGVVGVVRSPLPGPSGNVEFFTWLRQGPPQLDSGAVAAAVTPPVSEPGERLTP
ncbi:TlyA family RNA methyltransferase [Nocardioides sp. CFH 31398]|uniref:TlyA family RNA methyltransferase n=1 Tax=Nocardioides sp. CFH 31398 TaxID=2919579 RepID=UPI001F06BCA1|nr:TlyA family RNA methyltransferase [Nocardioides sp. CFH 31398]MCH1867037.1 TlyA family RNA methyltransferase [Nocardioides sp. CFH 31398]